MAFPSEVILDPLPPSSGFEHNATGEEAKTQVPPAETPQDQEVAYKVMPVYAFAFMMLAIISPKLPM